MISKQEMFNRAVRGLRSQGFERCVNQYGEGLYADSKGRHCAFGWIDTSIPGSASTWFVEELAAEKGTMASNMTIDELAFARELQWCHDESLTPGAMERRLKRAGERNGLEWPT